MTDRRKLFQPVIPTRYNNNKDKEVNTYTTTVTPPATSHYKLTVRKSYSHDVSNNYILAVVDAWRLLSSRTYSPNDIPPKFDQDLCIRLVTKYGLSCSDCKLECVQHELEAAK